MNNHVSSPVLHSYEIMASSVISWTETGSNKLKAHELITTGLDVKLHFTGDDFTEWLEAVATHARTMGVLSLFEHGPDSTITSPAHSLHATKSPSLNVMELFL